MSTLRGLGASELRGHWADMREYSESLIVWHVEVRAIQERQRAAEEELGRLAARPLWQRLWSRLFPTESEIALQAAATPVPAQNTEVLHDFMFRLFATCILPVWKSTNASGTRRKILIST